MKTRVNETIFSAGTWVIPMANVQHIEKTLGKDGEVAMICIVTDKTKWNFHYDTYENACFITNPDIAQEFLKVFSDYIAERDGMCESDVYKQ